MSGYGITMTRDAPSIYIQRMQTDFEPGDCQLPQCTTTGVFPDTHARNYQEAREPLRRTSDEYVQHRLVYQLLRDGCEGQNR